MTRPLSDVLALPDAEEFVRRSLGALEGEFRELALRSLADWERAGIVSVELFAAAAALQRPSWGSWNGLMAALRSARRKALRSSRPEERERAEKAVRLAEVLTQLDEPAGLDVRALSEFLRVTLKRAKVGDVLALPISLRNRVAHDLPGDAEWWKRAAEALRPVVAWQSGRARIGAESEAAPWVIAEDGESWSFNGLGDDFAAAYVSRSGAVRHDASRGREIVQALKRLLGKEEVQETDFRRLLTKLAPEELKGVMMGDFLVARPVGRGGFAQVHAGRQLSTGRKVAVKILHDGLDESSRNRFQQEAAFLARFDHPNIVRVLGYGEESWSAPRNFSLSGEDWFAEFSKGATVRSFIALEWIEGKTLEDVYRGERPATAVLTGWFVQAAEALSVVHAAGLIHRDVKPANLMVTEAGEIKLMDFGIARSQGEARTLVTTSGVTLGTPAYMSPEQIVARDAEAELGPSTDVYSLCATFYELFTGRRLFDHDRESEDSIRTRKTRGELPARPKTFAPGLPWELETILLGGLQKETGDRIRSMEALERDLRRFLNDEPIEYRRPSLARRAQLGYRRNRAVANFAAVSLLAAVAGISVYVVSLKKEQARTEEQRRTAVMQKSLAESNAAEAARQRDEAKHRLAQVHLEKAATAREQRRYQAAAVHLGAARDEDPTSVDSANWISALDQGHGPAWTSGCQFWGFEGEFSLSPDGRTAIGPSGTDFRIWDVQSGRALQTFQGRTALGYCVTFSPDGRSALSGSNDNSARLWDLETGKLVRTLDGHTDAICSVAFSPDGHLALTGSRDRSLRLWDVRTGSALRTFEGHSEMVGEVTFSPNGRFALSGSSDKTLRLWDVNTGQLIRRFEGHSAEVWSIAFSANARFVLSGSYDGTLRLWDVETGKSLRTFDGHSDGVRSVAFSPDGRFALSGSTDRTVRLWDIETGRSLRTFEGHTGPVGSVAFSPDGRCALSGGYDRTLRLWDVETGQSLRRFEGETCSVNSVAFSPDGRFALSGSDDRTLRLWDVPAGRPIRTFEGHTEEVSCVVFCPDGRYALSGSRDKTIRLWNVETGRSLRTFEGHTERIVSIAISPDGSLALSGSDDKSLRLWGVETGTLIRTFKSDSFPAECVAFSPNGRFALSGSYDQTLCLWSVETGMPLRSFHGHTGAVRSVAFSPDGRLAISGSDDRTLRLWNVETGQSLRTLEGHTEFVRSVAFSPDGLLALSGSDDKTVRLWDVETGKPLRTFEGHADVVCSVEFSPDGRFAVSGSQDRTLRLWDLETNRSLRTFEGHTGEVVSVAFSGSDSRLALSEGLDNNLRLWEVPSGRSLRMVEGPPKWITSIAVSPDGRLALSGGGGAGKTLLLWDAETGKPLRPLEGHTDEITCLAFSPDSRFALSGSDDKTLHLWDVQTGQSLRTFEGHTGGVTSVAFSPDGQFAFSGGETSDDGLRLWDVRTGKLLRSISGHLSGGVCSVAYSPDGRSVLTGGGDMRLWDLQTGKLVRKFEGHLSGGVRSVAYSPNGRFALSGSDDKTVRLWDVESGQSLRTFEGHTDSVRCVAFSPDGRYALSGSDDKSLRLWDVETLSLRRSGILDSPAAAREVSGLVLMGLKPVPTIPPLGTQTWTTPDGLPPVFLRAPLPDWLPPEEPEPDETVRKWRTEWEAYERSRIREACANSAHAWNDQFEGYRYREEPDGSGGAKRVPVPPREKDASGRYLGEPQGWIDWPRYWKERIEPRFAPEKTDPK